MAGTDGKCNALVDIKPGSFPNSINLGSGGKIPVAICTTDDLDATTVDPSTIEVAGANVAVKGKGTLMYSFENVCGDSRLDLVVHVLTQELTLTNGDVKASVTGSTYGGALVRGFDWINVVP